MTFDINSLNGITIAPATFNEQTEFYHPEPTPTYSNGVLQVDYQGYSRIGDGTPYVHFGGYYKITVLDSTYEAPTTVNGYSTGAVFGVLYFQSVSASGAPQASGSFKALVWGFNQYSLAITDSSYAQYNGQLRTYNGHYVGPHAGNAHYAPGYYSDQLAALQGSSLGTGIINLSSGFTAFPTTIFTTNAAADAAGVTFQAPPCFAEGTRVLTARGEVAVEDLVVGDEVVTASGQTRPAIWIGSRRVKVSAHPRPWEVAPVRVAAHAFAPGAPARELRLSPGHAVCVADAAGAPVLVPAGHLVNGATVVQEAVERVRYFHVELDAHDVLLAEGLACESYLDDGNRETFANGADHLALYGPLDPEEREGSCLPVLRDWAVDGAGLAAVRARLQARAEALGWRATAEPGLSLLADGAEIAPLHAADGRFWFVAPPAGELVLASRAGRPFDLVPGQMDSRILGVAVSELRLDGHVLALDAPALGAGFHGVEGHGDAAWRWTDGAARLDLGLATPALLEVALHMTALSWTAPKAPALRVVA